MWNSAKLPVGFRFEPTDEELICHYLARKVSGQTLPSNAVLECDRVYHVEPRLLPDANDVAKNGDRKKKMKAEALYFFVRMKKKTQNGSRPDRITGNGYWKASSGDQKIMVGKKEVGVKKMLSYFTYKDQNKKSSKDGRKTDWVMHEYALSNPHEQAKKFQPWTLCRISETGRISNEAPNDYGNGCSHKRAYVSQASSSRQIITQQVEEIDEQQNQPKKHKTSVTMEHNEAARAFICQELPSEIESTTESCELPDPSSSEQWFDVEELLGMLDTPLEHVDGLPNEAAGPLIPQELPSQQSGIASANELCELPDSSSSTTSWSLEEEWLNLQVLSMNSYQSGIESTASQSYEMESLVDSSSSTPGLSLGEWLYLQEGLGMNSNQSGLESASQSYEMESLPHSSSSTPCLSLGKWLYLQEGLGMNSNQSGIESASQSYEMEFLPDSSSSTPCLSLGEWLYLQQVLGMNSYQSGIERASQSYEMESLPDSSSTPCLSLGEWLYLQQVLGMNSYQSGIERASQSYEMESLPDSSSSTPCLSLGEWLYLQQVLGMNSYQSGIERASQSYEMESLPDSSSSTPCLSLEEWLYLQQVLGMNSYQSGIERASQSYEMESLPDSSSSTPCLSLGLGMLHPPQEHADGFPNEAAGILIPQELPSQQSGIENASKSCEMEALPDSSTSLPILSHEEWLIYEN